MPDSIYRVIRVVGSSPNSWEEAANHAIEVTSKNLRDLRVAEIEKFDLKIEDGKISAYRVRLSLSFKYSKDID